MKTVNAITVCVNYADLLAITLPRMLTHFTSLHVLTDFDDRETYDLCIQHSRVRVSRTNLFYHEGAKFNKGKAIEEALKDSPQCDGLWTCIIDADTYLPETMDLSNLSFGCLHSPYRSLLKRPTKIPNESEWSRLPPGWEQSNKEFAGYFQLFASSDPRFTSGPPWYSYSKWTTAQGCDSEFFKRWYPNNLVRLPFEVLHLGELRENWEGRKTERWGYNNELQ